MAYQAFQEQIDGLRKELAILKGQDAHMNRLQGLCSTRPSLNFQSCSKILQKFQTDVDRQEYLDSLDNSSTPAVEIPVSRFQVEFPVGTMLKNLNLNAEKAEVQKLATQAFQDWHDTVNQSSEKDALAFKAIWPEVTKYVKHVVDMEKVSPGYYQKFAY